jgi:CHASE3 domain sensor protein
MTTPSEAERNDLRSCEKLRQSRREDPQPHQRMSFMKKNTKVKMCTYRHYIEAEDRQSKITKYINSSNSLSKPRVTLEEINFQNNEKENKANELQSKLSEKDEEIKKIKVNNESLRHKVNESREEIKKRQKIIALSMVELAEMKRN